MPYATPALNKKADYVHEGITPGDIAHLHTLDRTHYDTPDSVRRCACTSCNEARRGHGARERTWQGIARSKA